MIIGISGTPGTGKTTVSEHLDYDVVDLKAYAEREGMGDYNSRGELEIDLDKLSEDPPRSEQGDLVVEGHLAHFIGVDYCIVLRCRPDVLRERLETRDYSEEKISENVESEKLDIILSQAVQSQETVFEIDTTDKEIQEVAEKVERAVKDEKVEYGNVDWSEFI